MAADTPASQRSAAADKYKWDPSEIYPDATAFSEDLAGISNALIPRLEEYRGKLNTAANIKSLLELNGEIEIALDKPWLYVQLLLDVNQDDAEAQRLFQQFASVYSEYTSASSFITPEIIALSEETLTAMMNDPDLSLYKMKLENLLDQKNHVLSAEEEELLAQTGKLRDSAYSIFRNLMYSDFQYATIEDNAGQEIELTDARYRDILQSPDRALREKAYRADTANLAAYNNTLAAIYASHLKNDTFYAQARNYESSLDQALASENMPPAIYNNLISTTKDNLKPLQDYYALRQQTLGYSALYLYDLSAPLVPDYQKEIPYEEAVQIIRKALQPMGSEYIAKYDQAINSRWIDVYPDENKNTGGYCTGSYLQHPYILLNYDGSLSWVSALAHEIGHAVNFVDISAAQEPVNFGVSIITAEVVSTFNELLLMHYLIENAASDQEKIYLLQNHIENLANTFFSQVRLAEFEQRAHELAEADRPLTPQALNNIWLSITQEYYGDTVNLENVQGVDWSAISHLYDSFYVYNYAASIAAAYALADDILAGDKESLGKYLDFLQAGTSDYPAELLQKAGVDMTSPEPIEAFIQYFGQLVDELGTLLASQTTPTYTVQPGDVLWKIAEKYGLTWQELAEMNNLANPNLLIPGKELVLYNP